MRFPITGCLLFVFAFFVACHSTKRGAADSWAVYGGSQANTHYTSLTVLDTGNVSGLRQVWEYHTRDGDSLSQIQVNPLVIDGVLYGVSPKLKLFALNAATGEMRWVFDPAAPVNGDTPKIAINACRGVAYYSGRPADGAGGSGADSATDQRLFYGAGSYLYCIDAATGKPAAGFGDSGRIDLHHDLGRDVRDLYVAATTPGMVYKDMIII
ncbi:MAG TPA: hypothetical protein VKQ52_04490, partial [Puia sp.]|nr:hypothetical protein [Puia sp.]